MFFYFFQHLFVVIFYFSFFFFFIKTTKLKIESKSNKTKNFTLFFYGESLKIIFFALFFLLLCGGIGVVVFVFLFSSLSAFSPLRFPQNIFSSESQIRQDLYSYYIETRDISVGGCVLVLFLTILLLLVERLLSRILEFKL